MPEYSFAIHHTITGVLDTEFPATATAGGQWAPRLETGGTASGVIQTNDRMLAQLSQAVLHDLSDPTGEYSLVVKCEGQLVAAAVILTSEHDEDTGVLSVQGKDVGDVFWPARMTSGVNIKDQGSLTITNRSYSGAVRAILQRATQWGVTWPLPIDLPADGAGDFSAHWDWWEFRTIQELFDQVRKEGVKIHLRPYLNSAGVLRYETLVGTSIITGRVPLTAKVPGSPVVGLKYRRDGSKVVTGVQVVGNGKGSGVLTAWAGVPLAGRPIRDAYVSGGEITEQARLQKIADHEHSSNAEPVVEWSHAVQADGLLHPSMFLPGTVEDMSVFGSRVIPDGVHALQVVALTGDVSSARVTPEVVPYAG